MTRRSRRNHPPVFEAKAALAALKGEETLTQLAERFDVHANQITQWKSQLLEHAADVFASASERSSDAPGGSAGSVARLVVVPAGAGIAWGLGPHALD